MKAPLLFSVVCVILIVMVYLIHYHRIQTEVRKTSRCLRMKTEHSAGGLHTVTAVNENSDKLYNITYDLGAKTSSVDCACAPGPVVNHFKDIHYYNFKEKDTRVIDDKMCGCDSVYDDPRDQIFFDGTPGLVRYMLNKDDTSYFMTDPTYSLRMTPANPTLSVTADAPANTGANPYPETSLYEVTYNIDDMLKGKTTFHRVRCVAPKGDTVLSIPSIRVYKKTGTTTDSLTCNVDRDYSDALSNLTFRGTPGLVAFMQNPAQTGVFTAIMPAT